MRSETRLANLAVLSRLGLVDSTWPRPLLDYLGSDMTGDLHLRGFGQFHCGTLNLPAGLRVGGSLDLSWSSIKTLPPGLRVGGDLYLIGTAIRELPPGLWVGGRIIGLYSLTGHHIDWNDRSGIR